MKHTNKKVKKVVKKAAKSVASAKKSAARMVKAHTHSNTSLMHNVLCACGGMMEKLGAMLVRGSKKLKGFTLIELLIVVAIIGILAVSLLPNIVGAPAAARDAARKVDLNNVVAALEQYYAANGKYPTTKSCVNDTLLGTYFKGGKAPTSTMGTVLSTACGTVDQYVYCPLPASTGYSYYVVGKMEKGGSGKNYIESSTPPTDCGATAPSEETVAGRSKLFYLLQ